VNGPPQPKQLSWKFRAIYGGVIVIGISIFFLALHHPRSDAALPSIKGTTDGWWLHQEAPTPTPAPLATPKAALRPIVVQPPPRPLPSPTPKVCQVCIEREMRYRKAIETGMGTAASSVRGGPPTPNAQPSPNIFAYQGGASE
jgi:hypothetical protein